MRAALDAIFCCVTALLFFGAMMASALWLDVLGLHGWLGAIVGTLVSAAVAWLGYSTHHAVDARLFGQRGPIESLADLAARGLVESTPYRARRSCEIDSYDDEGAHYLLELEDDSVLLISGQLLWDYEPLDDPEFEQPRRFPCTEFVVHRHRVQGYVIAIDCAGDVIEPGFILDDESLEPIREALGWTHYDEVTHQAHTSFDTLIQLGREFDGAAPA